MFQQVTLSWQSDMQLAGKLVLSATALLLLTLAYRFYRSRSLAASTIPPAEALGEERGNAARDGDTALRRRRVFGGDGQGTGSGTRQMPPHGERRLPRGEEEEEEEEGRGEMVLDLESSCGRARMAGKGSKLGSEMGIELGREMGRELGSEQGMELESEMGRELGSEQGIELGSEMGRELGSEQAMELESEQGSDLENNLARKAGKESGIDPGNKSGKEPGCELGSELESNLARKTEKEPGNNPGKDPGSEPRSHELGDTAETRSSHKEGTFAPSTSLSPGIAQKASDRRAQNTEKDLAVGSRSCWVKGHGEMIQTLSITSDLGLTMMASNKGSEASYSFSSVAKIQVEENFITEQLVKDGAGQPTPGLKGKVYDYCVQSISQSVLKNRCLRYIPQGISQHRSPHEVHEELQSFATQELDPDVTRQDPSKTSVASTTTESSETSPEPPSPSLKNSLLQIADSSHLHLPMEGFGVMGPARTTPASPWPEVVASSDLSQTPPHTHLDLGNCYEVLCTAKAQKLGHLQEAAYKVMSDNYLQVLRTPSIYGRLNAGERELILRRRMKGKMHMAVVDVSVQEPGLHTSRLCYYDDREDRWHQLCRVPPEVVSLGCAVCSMFNYLFVVAGCEGRGRAQRSSSRVFCYNPVTNIWREICPLNQARPHCKLVALDGHLYAIGGECLYTVERYDPRQDRWTFAAPLPHDTFAVAHTATVCDGEIYVTGGTLRYVLLRYTPRLDSWTVTLASGRKDRTVEMVSTKGFIYRFDLHRTAGISVYRCSAKAKLWYECAVYSAPNLSSFQCSVLGSLVHCIGRHFHVRFLADHISPRFGTKELQPFPSPRGSLLPAVLVLPEGGMAQAQV